MKRSDLAVYFIMGTENCVKAPLQTLEEALAAGITMFQLREKGSYALKGEAYIQFARQCQALCTQYNVPFVINDDVALAVLLEADGLHIGQDDAQLQIAKAQFKGFIGVSVHTADEMATAIDGGCAYVGIGPIYATSSKADANLPCHAAFPKAMHEQFPECPIVAIGGIEASNVAPVLATGVDGVAVISAICHSSDIQQTVKQLKGETI